MKQTSYRQGTWLAVAGPKACLLLPGTQKQRAVELWSMVDDGADFDEVLDALVAQGLRGLSGFVLLSGESDVRVLVRGDSVVTAATATGTRELTGAGTLTWIETMIPDVTSLKVVVDLAEGTPLPLRGGLVRVGELEVSEDLAETTASPSQPELPAAMSDADPLGLGEQSFDAPDRSETLREEMPEDGPGELTDAAFDVAADPLGAPPAWTPGELEAELGPPPPLPPTGMPPLPPLVMEDPLAQVEAPLGPPPSWTPAPLAEPDTQPDTEPDIEPGTELSSLSGPEVDPYDPHDPHDPHDPEDENPTEFIPQAPAAPQGPTLIFSDGQALTADRTIVVGRAPDPSRSSDPSAAGIRVPSPHQEISSTHIEIQPGEGHAAVIVTDLGSTNGTVVVQPGAGPEELRPGVPVVVVTGTMIDLGDSLTIHVGG